MHVCIVYVYFLYVCMYTCMYFMYMCMCISCMYLYMYVCICVSLLDSNSCMYVFMYVCICVSLLDGNSAVYFVTGTTSGEIRLWDLTDYACLSVTKFPKSGSVLCLSLIDQENILSGKL